MPITKILLQVDLSERSLGAAIYAKSLAAELRAELVFLHALQRGWPLATAEKNVRDRILDAAGHAHRFLFREGSPVSVILNTAEVERVNLILVPARGTPALSRFFGHSTTAQVLRGAHCAVWVGLDNLPPLSNRPIRNVLCGLSLGPRASAILCWSAALAARFDARLSVIHASTALESNPRLPFDEEWRIWLNKITRDDIRALQTGVGTDAEVWLEPGTPLTAIPPLADHVRADLLVIGKSPHRRFFGDLRTLSYDIACRVGCPVASV
ncbi:MAG TPA: universal stress protein [Bryobacteraceae bacterium]|nr:universal stress protein [Bryobacteraceae bacterium]